MDPNNGILVDVLNVVCEREDSMRRPPRFDYDSFVKVMKEIEQKYSKNTFYCIPEYLSYKKHLRKINDEGTLNFFKKQIKDKKIILTRNGKEKDDVTLVSIAMNLGMGIISKDKKMEKHVINFSDEIKQAAIKFIRENRIDYHFINGRIAIDGFIPKKFEENN